MIMKKFCLYALMAIAPSIASAQEAIVTGSSEEEEEFIKESFIVVDTAKVA